MKISSIVVILLLYQESIPLATLDNRLFMKRLFCALLGMAVLSACHPVLKIQEYVSSTMDMPWQVGIPMPAASDSVVLIEICPDSTGQVIRGFGVSFSELSAYSLSLLTDADRKSVLDELFIPGQGANLVINRTPVGANDFSLDWYSYDEVDQDFGMKRFSVSHDEQWLIPLIREALSRNPEMTIWASPWCPPTWMKYNKHYAMRPDTVNDLPESGRGHEGKDMFVQKEEYFEAYALYFEKYIQAYREHGIDISMVMPQNEPNSAQNFPSCCWTSAGLTRFISHLGPRMDRLGVDLWFGTCERPKVALIDSILTDPVAGKFIKGVGFQWAGRSALPVVKEKYPEMDLMMTEQECGNGRNDWSGVSHAWELMKHYLSNGVSAYDYWNMALPENCLSRWGWRQNSLVTVDSEQHTFRYTIEYYLLKHVSHYVQSGAKLLRLPAGTDALAFLNPDGSIALVAANPLEKSVDLQVRLCGREQTLSLPPCSFNTLII